MCVLHISLSYFISLDNQRRMRLFTIGIADWPVDESTTNRSVVSFVESLSSTDSSNTDIGGLGKSSLRGLVVVDRATSSM